MTQSKPKSWRLTARWVFPGVGPPLERGTVFIDGDRIVAVEPYSKQVVDLDLGDRAVLPGLVNAHTHLDLTGLRHRVPPQKDFSAWLRDVIAQRRVQTPSHTQSAIQAGITESITAGTTLLGDISAGGLSWEALQDAPARSVVFYELLGLPRDRARKAWRDAREWLDSRNPTSSCRPGLSPHAPYSVRASLFRLAAIYCRQRNLPLTIHVSESQDEELLLDRQDGPFKTFLQELGVWDPTGLIPDIAQLLRLHAKNGLLLMAHGNYLPPNAPIPEGSVVVYCPRTHAAFGHSPYPLRQFLASGLRVALGTDGLSSNPDLSVLEEARYVRRLYPDVPGEVLLRMATLTGAEALGWRKDVGSLEAGKSADLVVLPLPPTYMKDPHDLIFAAQTSVQGVLCRGRWLRGEWAEAQRP